MASSNDHLTQADHNRDFINIIWPKNLQYPDWAVTVIFYTAIHLIEAYFDHHLGKSSHDYQDREDTIIQTSELKPIYPEYHELKRLSMDSRYRCIFAKWTPKKVQEASSLLNKIETHLDTLLQDE